MKKYIVSFVCILFAFIAFPQSSQAFSVIKTSAIDLGNGTALFTITYKFGFLNRETYLPIITTRANDGTKETRDSVSYQLMIDGKKTETIGVMTGLVLSDAKIKDNSYYLPKGTSAELTLVAILTIPPASLQKNVSLAITSLPFTMVDGSREISAAVADTEIGTYKTKVITLK